MSSTFEIRLANGKTLGTESGRELRNFLLSRGTSIADPPRKPNYRKNRKGKRLPQKLG